MSTLKSGNWLRIAAVATALAAALATAGCNDSSSSGCQGPGCAPYTPLTETYGLAAADFNGDGKLDLATVSWFSHGTPGNVSLYLHDASANTFAAPLLTANGTAPSTLTVADINGDGYPDLITSSNDGGFVSVLLNSGDGHGTFGAPAYLASNGATGVAVGDLNGDGVPDLVVADYPVSMFLQSATSRGTFSAPVGLYSGGAATVLIGDLNGDHLQDVVLVDAVGVKVLFHGADPMVASFAVPVSVYTQTPNAFIQGGNLIAIADIDGDGLNDLVVADPGPSGGAAPVLSVLLNDAMHPGQFLAPLNYPLPAYTNQFTIKVADLNGDGRPDIIVGGDSSLTVFLQQSSGAHVLLAGTSYSLMGGDAFQLEVADLNGDGAPDIVTTSGPTRTLVGGAGVTRPGVLYQDPLHPGTFGPLMDAP